MIGSLGAGCNLVLAVLVGQMWVAAATAAPPPAPPGLDPKGTEFAIVANNGWRVATDGVTFAPVAVSLLHAAPKPDSTDAAERQQRAHIWARVCTASKQTLTFRRTYFLPGRPKTFGAVSLDTTFSGGAGDTAISSMRISINGKLALGRPGANVTLNEQERKGLAALFKFGDNVIDVVVVKRVQQGSFGKCINGTPGRRLGIYFSVHGTYEADLWIEKNGSGDEVVYRRPTAEDGQAFVIGVTPKNLGPSGVYTGTARLEITADEILADASKLSTTGQGLRNCVFTQPASAIVKIACEIFRMPAGATARVTIPLVVKFRDGYDVATVFIYREVKSDTRDIDGDSNFRRFFFKFCSETSADPKCPP